MQAIASLSQTAPPGLARASIGLVPNLWNNADVPDLSTPTASAPLVAEVARLGYSGVQLNSSGELRGRAMVDLCRQAAVRVAENYAVLDCTVDGPPERAIGPCRRALDDLVLTEGDVVVLACGLAPERADHAARVSAKTPRLSKDGWKRLGRAVDQLAREARDRGKRLSFHNHVGTFVETVSELDQLALNTDPALVGICLDVGHYTLAGGDPTAALRTLGARIDHVHLKDVSSDVRQGMRYGSVPGFIAGLRARVFTELGTGVLDLKRVLRLLALRGYSGWLMVEQDTSWRPPAESAAVSHALLMRTLAELKAENA